MHKSGTPFKAETYKVYACIPSHQKWEKRKKSWCNQSLFDHLNHGNQSLITLLNQGSQSPNSRQ